MIVEIHDAPDSFARHWQEMQTRDIHAVTGPYLRSLEAAARAVLVDATWSYLGDLQHCNHCGATQVQRHEADCPVGALAALVQWKEGA
jgi:hypothetical protein